MNDDYYTTEDTKVSKATTEGTTKIWLRKTLFNPIFIFIFINIILIMFIIYWRYIRPKWNKKYTKNYYNLKGLNTLILQTKKKNMN